MPHLAGDKCRFAPAVNSQQAKVCRVWYGLRRRMPARFNRDGTFGYCQLYTSCSQAR
ncbi:hypothetical protein A628_02964 [Salmonella enterica subsp. enterica serovar Cubana str. 76814]|uniref:Uncharacterized protein n=1 Tax=Salmonella enterica subsp. enterica serovar Cubana str. 76814 TaxID=1192560 RepID=V7IQ44_SALET|nr:hypothetical protein A628_02964 [Salmonella enterica subsp. enterica serovar Cubana str. 76814]